MKLLLLWALALAAAVLPACGGSPKVDTDTIRRHADDADRDIDRESEKHEDE